MKPATIETPSPRQKALEINLDPAPYGTFAEIGAGQEVARWFFRVGGAAGTVAKTISAYDMAVSDALYGPSDRYVTRQRLESILDHEFAILLRHLEASRSERSKFFVFADTVAARSYTRQEEGHGWMGIRFQSRPREKPSEIIIHLRLLDRENSREQEALGIMGVNLVHAAFFHHAVPQALIGALLDSLAPERVSVDMIKFSGPCFKSVDNRLMSLQLVEQKLTDAATFTAGGEVVQASELLYKKPILIQRGSFRPITNTVEDMLQQAERQLRKDPSMEAEDIVVLSEMTLQNLLMEQRVNHQDFLARANILGALGRTVFISSYAHYYKVADYLYRYTQKINMVLGVPGLSNIFEEKYYEDLDGKVLEGIGKLFKAGVRLYVHPSRDPVTGELVTAESMKVAPRLRRLKEHLLENGLIVPISGFDPSELHVFPSDVLNRIQSGDPSWESMVPPKAAAVIKRCKYFGCGDGSCNQ